MSISKKNQLLLFFLLTTITLIFRVNIESTNYCTPDSNYYLEVTRNMQSGLGPVGPKVFEFNKEKTDDLEFKITNINLNSNNNKESKIHDIENSEINNCKNLEEKIIKKASINKYNEDNFKSYNSIKNLINWLNLNDKTFFPKIEIKFYSEAHRGVIAKRKINVSCLILYYLINQLLLIE